MTKAIAICLTLLAASVLAQESAVSADDEQVLSSLHKMSDWESFKVHTSTEITITFSIT